MLDNSQNQRFFEKFQVKAQLGTEHSRVFPQHSRGWVAQETLDPSRFGGTPVWSVMKDDRYLQVVENHIPR